MAFDDGNACCYGMPSKGDAPTKAWYDFVGAWYYGHSQRTFYSIIMLFFLNTYL